MSLQQRDRKHIWHPLTQHKTSSDPIGIVKAKGALLFDENKNTYIDGIASWYTAMYGHCNDTIIEAVCKQMQQLDQVVFTGFTHEPAVQLSEKLMAILPSNQQKIFFNDNGSTAVDAAIKMAFQYYFNKGTKRNTLIAFDDGFHGDTFGAMSVSSLSVYNGPFEDFFLKVERIPVPTAENNVEVLSKLKTIISENDCAAFIYEPLVQGAAGMKFHSAEGLEQLLKLCKQNDILCIADEVMTGFGKTGKNFASEYLETKPDIMCLSKALTAGVAAMSITSCTQTVFDAFLDNEIAKGFFHAHTYSANPLACAAAIAGIDLLTSEAIQGSIHRIENAHRAFSEKIIQHPKVASVRQLGVIFALDLNIEMERYGNLRNELFSHFMTAGVFLRPLGNTIYILPPFVISDSELQTIYTAIESCLPIV
ncbi:adenosylmethionine--8-amino-7-oxononanoate transaminase [Ulvibacter litoralis]|uniref:Adenosylmethionine-8-amino-7-oxononanoate aminotransferase n=1 Tax=Ulvibacter litoralis TaxID=227084 RepID=A0A1G7CV56_9FLAO|nr:adenosylmethionine--8-amino-7-oxononanoate transaminase [Ulvibacter litoralis]GHC45923.1 adenosylmethionine--8-amino-7-oxononanoate aminotransferase BioA [Ulvibacter litoralis]SDE43208.1 adenosylmethionine-8-amino-7-oxononanoate aminotransferase [Ulvibacter litoralis]